MRIALVYDLRDDYRALGYSEEEIAEFDSVETIDHLAAVVSEITAFGRPPELHRTATSVHALLDECLTLGQAR